MRIAVVSLLGLLFGALPAVETASRPAANPAANRAKPTPKPSPAGKPTGDPDQGPGEDENPKTLRLSGKVVNRDGAAVAGAQVTIGSKTTTTGSDGVFTYEGPGAEITVKKGGKSQDFHFSDLTKTPPPGQLNQLVFIH